MLVLQYSALIRCFVSGPRYWIKWQNELHLLSDVGYFALTTFAGIFTLFRCLRKSIHVGNCFRVYLQLIDKEVVFMVELTKLQSTRETKQLL